MLDRSHANSHAQRSRRRTQAKKVETGELQEVQYHNFKLDFSTCNLVSTSRCNSTEEEEK